MRVLFVTPRVPSRLQMRSYHWIRGLASLGHEVELFAIARGRRDRMAVDDIRRYCAAVTVESMPRWRPLWNSVDAVRGREPLVAASSRHPALATQLRGAAAAGAADVVHIERIRASAFAPMVAGLPLVYDAVQSAGFFAEQSRVVATRSSVRWRARLDARRTNLFERELLYRFERVLVASPVDGARIRDAAATADASSRLVVLRSPVDLEYFRPADGLREPATVVFSGNMRSPANGLAARQLVETIMPRVWSRRGDVRVVIAGSGPDASVRKLGRDARVQVTGHVPDLRVFFARATLAVCPSVYGGGLETAVLEAMASGVPVLASHRAVAALDAEPGIDVAVADSADDFAAGILHLLESPRDRQMLARRGRAYVTAHHHTAALGRTLERAYYDAIQERRSRS